MGIVIIKYYDNDIAKGILIEGRTYARVADIADGLGLYHEWFQGIPHELMITGTITGTVPLSSEFGYTLNDIQISENFNLKEFQCKCGCGTAKIHPDLVRKLQALREELGQAIIVNSGYRCPVHNKKVGGAADSQHLHGTAADITAKDLPRLILLAEKYFQNQGVGLYKTFVHVDVRGYKARWRG